ncbi:MAG: hypothetical protein ACOH2F_12180 [Cellulomonas sp.]
MTTIRVDFDQDSWLYVPESWPWNGFENLDHWVATVCDLLGPAHQLDATTTTWLGTSLQAIAAARPDDESRFIYLAAPDRFLFFVSVLYTASDDLTLEDLAAVNDPAATRKPESRPFVSPQLGEGIRSLRHVDTGGPDHDLAAIVQYAWKSGGLDVVVIAADFNLVLVDELLPVIDELALSISVVA